MVFIPITTVGRILLGTIIFFYIALLVLNLVSFGGIAWITYVDYNIQFGLWRVCYGAAASAASNCEQWSDSTNIVDSATGVTIFSGKPSFVKAAEGLEIVSLIFYVFAGVFIILGIVDLERAPLEYMFGAAAILLFLCMIFLSASLGVMSDQGRSNHPGAYQDWAWSTGIAGLVMTIVCMLALIAFIIYIIRFYDFSSHYIGRSGDISRFQGQQAWNSYPPMWAAQNTLPPFYPYPSYNQWLPEYQGQQFNPTPYFPNSGLPYNGFYQQQPAPNLTFLIRERLGNSIGAQRQQQIFQPYGQNLRNIYF